MEAQRGHTCMDSIHNLEFFSIASLYTIRGQYLFLELFLKSYTYSVELILYLNNYFIKMLFKTGKNLIYNLDLKRFRSTAPSSVDKALPVPS